ncbi:pre-mRNA-processing protein 40C isoform X2 [Alnus glutinosa]|uniref:pre-mRNA-processing protein 40C isoform X2 n=1 Tax=Alnus glutinosa TaxID=3517 RepID=UPI002D76A6F0|nr:pre-mRNA-processing protein 40C isoform X2 [Alnus glutinosa]
MASPAWLTPEMQPSTPRATVPGLPAVVSSGGPSTPTPTAAAPAPGASTPTSKGSISTSSGSVQGPAQARFASAPGYVVRAPSFSYNVFPNATTPSGSSQQSSSTSVINSDPPASPMVVQPPVTSLSSSAAPSFSYNISHSSVAFPSNWEFQSSANTSAAVTQAAGIFPSASTISQSVSLPADTSSSSTIPVSSTPNLSQATSWMPSAPSFSMPTGMPGTPGTPGPPGIATSAPISSSLTFPSAVMDSSSSAVLRPTMPTAPIASNSIVQPQICPPYASFPAMAPPPQGIWLQPPQMGGIPMSPFQPYPTAFPGPFPLPARGMPLPSVPLPDSQPPGVTPVGTALAISVSSAASGHMLAGTLKTQTELPPPDNRKHVDEVGTHNGAAFNEQLDAWAAHKTEAGVVYYYNALTGESTYAKPPGFRGELDKVLVQPTPASMVNISGTDWVLVTTSDGKKYYYNSKTKISSWQIPCEVTELKKKQDGDTLREPSISLPHTNISTEKGPAPISLNAPAINTGGRDAMALKTSIVPGSSSALDLIKKKLQDSGAPGTSSPGPAPSGTVGLELNGSGAVDTTVKGLQSGDSRDKQKDANGDGNMSDSTSDSEDADSGPTKEECIIQFKEMLKERGVAPFSKWEKELPKIVFDPRFKAIPSYSARRSLFEHYVKTRAEEERKEKRAAQKAAIEGFKQLLDQASKDIDHDTDYQTFRKKWGSDPRFQALDRKDREHLLNERVLPLKRAAEEKAQALRAAATTSFKSLLRDKGDITINSRWSKVKDSLRNDPRYKSVKHEDREVLFNEYISELKAGEEELEREAKAKREEQEKLKEREREFRKRKEREEQEMERVRMKVRRKETVASFQALLVETIKDPLASWTESKPRLEKDPQGRATNPDLDPSDTEKLFREHIKMLNERCVHDFRALLAEVLTAEAASRETEDGKTALHSWSTAKRLLKPDPRYNKMPRKEREVLWRRYADEMLRKQKLALDHKEEKHGESKGRSSVDSGRFLSGSRTHERR